MNSDEVTVADFGVFGNFLWIKHFLSLEEVKLNKNKLFTTSYDKIVLILLIIILWQTQWVLAQEQGPAMLRITKIDKERFPEVSVYIWGKNLGVDLATADIQIEQDGIQYPTTSEVLSIGTQTAIVIDASGSIRGVGNTGDPRYIEIGNIMTRLISRNKLSVQYDWMAAFVPEKNNIPKKLHDWSLDHQSVTNSIYLFEPPKDVSYTPLFNLLFNTLSEFDVKNIDTSFQRTMIVFSDGVDVVSGLQLDDVVNQAQEKGIVIYTVMLGPSKPQTRSNLERIAVRTGGSYYELTSLDALDTMWDQILTGREQRILTYRSQMGSAEEVTAVVTLPDGRRVSAKAPLRVTALPAQIEVQYPPQGLQLVRKGESYDIPLTELEPRELPIQLAFVWPNGIERKIRRVEITIGNDTRVIENEPFHLFAFPLGALGAGNYTLRVRMVDDLGIVSESLPVLFSIVIDQPPAPTPTPVVEIKIIEQISGTSYAALIIGLISFLVALIVFFRKPERREMATTFVTGTIKTLTEPWRKREGKTIHEQARARLIAIGSDSKIPSPVLLQGIRKFGRDPSLADVVLSDPHVSRYHCRIVEEADGTFRLYDEGSTSGTYVNDETVAMSGQILRLGDVINIGPVAYRFELLESQDNTIPYSPHKDEQDPTLPYYSRVYSPRNDEFDDDYQEDETKPSQ